MPRPAESRPDAARSRRRRVGRWTILRHPGLLFRFLTDRRAPALPKILAVLAVLYVVMPLDAIPDVIPIVGWLDDAGVASAVMAYVLGQVAKHQRALQGADAYVPS